jgi:hypothetical protein
MKHIHAELMMKYAQDAMETDKPWMLWESKDEYDECWKTRFVHPRWIKEVQYRRKPKTININGFYVPEPLRDALNNGETYYIAEVHVSKIKNRIEWANEEIDFKWLSLGICHKTIESAQKHADALLSFTRNYK